MRLQTPNPESVHSVLGLAIRQRRQLLGLSQEELGRRAGLHRTYVTALETKPKNFAIEVYLQLAVALEIYPSELLRIAETVAYAKLQLSDKRAGKARVR